METYYKSDFCIVDEFGSGERMDESKCRDKDELRLIRSIIATERQGDDIPRIYRYRMPVCREQCVAGSIVNMYISKIRNNGETHFFCSDPYLLSGVTDEEIDVYDVM